MLTGGPDGKLRSKVVAPYLHIADGFLAKHNEINLRRDPNNQSIPLLVSRNESMSDSESLRGK